MVFQVVTYCLALALEKTGVILYAACFMSNHHHLVVCDPHGVLPNFLRELHRPLAKALNALQGRWENLWSAEPCSVVRLVDAHDVADKIAYVAANPVAAGLVAQPEQWPGLLVWGDRAIRVVRPKVYFDERGSSPRELVLRSALPLAAGDEPRASWWNRTIARALAGRVAEAHRKMRSACRTFLGRAGVLAQKFVDRATSYEPKRVVVPSIAAKDPSARSAMLALQRAFRGAYRAAVAEWKRGIRDVVFPFGTWWMRVHHQVLCSPGATPT